MKKANRLLFIFLVLPFILSAQSLVNNGAAITIKSGTAIKLKGDYVNQQNGRIKNDGFINVDGNWSENSTASTFLPATGGVVKITGTSSHFIGGSYYPVFPSLGIETNVILQAPTYISQQLILTNGKMSIGNFDLQMFQNATIAGATSNRYIITDGSGSLLMQVEGSEKWFPVGTALNYAPAAIVNNNTADEIAVRVFDDVLTNGTSGTPVVDIEETVKHTWEVSDPDGSIASPDLDFKMQWSSSMEGLTFDRTQAAVSQFNGSAWQFYPLQGAGGSNPYFINQIGISSLGAFTVKTKRPIDIVLDLKVFLEGPYNATVNTMETTLNTQNHIPLSQPYNPSLPYYNESNPVWLYNGTENIATIPSGVVDWVLIQLRDATSPASASSLTIRGTRAAFVKSDGSIVNIDGSSFPVINSVVDYNLYPVVFHRNHLGVISTNALVESGGVYTYDFSTSAGQAYGGTNGHKELETGVWGMVSGDGNGNGLIQNTDETAVWKVDLGQSGYKGGDFNMNGLVQNTDETNYWKVNLGAGGQTPGKSNQSGYKSQVPE
ncbi:MAG: hypothetical protein KQI35_05575 [Bacteroidetes bacterium]|nr:hypothetical protein [Bacteroidota bacterium]